MLGLEVLTAPAWQELRFAAMGTDVHLVLRGSPADGEWAEREIRRLESHWSRFLPHSDVARANRAAGTTEVAAAIETLDLVAAAIEWWHRTDGRFDPTVLHALQDLGYDAPFAVVRDRPASAPLIRSAPPGLPALRIPAAVAPPAPHAAPGCGGIVVDRAAGTLSLPAGVGIDLGGIGKGAAADRVVDGLRARGVDSACVGLGGDVRAYGPGNGPDGRGWSVDVEDPHEPGRVLFTRVLDDGAVVTSTDRFRRWTRHGREHHHLIDPATGRPARTGLAAVIVADRCCARAEVLAKAAFVAGPDDGAALLDRFGVDGWFVADRPVGVDA